MIYVKLNFNKLYKRKLSGQMGWIPQVFLGRDSKNKNKKPHLEARERNKAEIGKRKPDLLSYVPPYTQIHFSFLIL